MVIAFKMKRRLPYHIQSLFKKYVKLLNEVDADAIYLLEPVVEGSYKTAYRINIKKPMRIGKKLRITGGLQIRIRNYKGNLQLDLSSYIRSSVTRELNDETFFICGFDGDYFEIDSVEKSRTLRSLF